MWRTTLSMFMSLLPRLSSLETETWLSPSLAMLTVPLTQWDTYTACSQELHAHLTLRHSLSSQAPSSRTAPSQPSWRSCWRQLDTTQCFILDIHSDVVELHISLSWEPQSYKYKPVGIGAVNVLSGTSMCLRRNDSKCNSWSQEQYHQEPSSLVSGQQPDEYELNPVYLPCAIVKHSNGSENRTSET